MKRNLTISLQCHSVLCFVLLFSMPLDLAAQLNLTAGYEALYGGTAKLNDVLENFNQEVDEADIRSIHVQHGFSIGARYQFSSVNLNLAFAQTFNRRSTEDVFFKGQDTELSFSHGMATYSAGLEFGRTFILGGSINYHRLRTAADFAGQEETVLREGILGNRFYVGIQSRGDTDVSIAVKPFVQVLWSDIDLRSIEGALNPGGSEACFYCKESRPLYLGLSVTIQNGRHR